MERKGGGGVGEKRNRGRHRKRRQGEISCQGGEKEASQAEGETRRQLQVSQGEFEDTKSRVRYCRIGRKKALLVREGKRVRRKGGMSQKLRLSAGLGGTQVRDGERRKHIYYPGD